MGTKGRVSTTIRFDAATHAALKTIKDETGALVQYSVEKAVAAYLASPAIRTLLAAAKKKRAS